MAKKGVKSTPPPSGPKRGPAPETIPTTATERRYTWISAAFAALAFLLYFNTLGHQYVLDDPLAIGGNAFVKKGISGIPDLLSHHYRAGTEAANASALLYRPLSAVTFAIEWSLSPGSPFLGHLMNVLWYALTLALLFAALRRIFHQYHWLWAVGATLLFAAHPLHTEVVANIKSRDEILNVFFSVAALYAWARWLAEPAGRWITLALGSYFLALLSKESAVTVLPIFALVSWTFFNKTARESAGHALLFVAPLALFLVIRALVLGKTTDNFVISEMDNPIVAAAGFGERSATSFMVLWKYFQLLVFPQPLLSDYSYRHLQVVGWANWQAWAGLLLYGGMGVFALRGLLRRQPLAFCVAAFLCAVALYSQLFLVIGTLFGERLMYMPSLWFCVAAALVFWQFWEKAFPADGQAALPQGWWRSLAIPTLVAALFAMTTLARNPDWRDNLSLFRADSSRAPESIRLHNGMGSELYNRYLAGKDLSEAEKEALLQEIEQHSRAALAVRPNPVSYLNLGNAAVSRRQYAESIQQYENALKEAPQYGIARINIGRTYQAWGREEGQQKNNPARAAELFEKAIEYGAGDAETYLNLGTAYGMSGQNDKAIANFEKALALNPQNKTILKNLSIAYRSAGNLAKAEEFAQRAR